MDCMEVYREEPGLKNKEGYPFEIEVQARPDPGMMALPHFHDFVEILFCQKGAFEAQLGTQRCRFGVGDMVLIHSQEVHRTFALSEGINQYVVIKFVPELLFSTEQTALELQYLLAFTSGLTTSHRVFAREDLRSTFIPRLIPELVREQDRREYGFEMAIRVGLCRLFLWILRRWHAQGVEIEAISGISREAMHSIQSVFDYVDEHYGSKVNMDAVAHMLNMSYSAFSKFFTRHTGMNFTDYLNDLRITKSKILLATTDLSVTEIALEVGFSTTSYFIHCFKAKNRVTPQRFRKQFSSKLPPNHVPEVSHA